MTMTSNVPLSVLDLAPVMSGSPPTQALRNMLDLARRVERLGYLRYWLAEHHNTACIASSSPAVLIGHVADATTTLRVGAGGVMLPNHPTLLVAEQFGTLEALHPGRIDLGIGRGPGTDPATARLLRWSNDPPAAAEFPAQVSELIAYFQRDVGSQPIIAVPAPGNQPPIWMLGSSSNSARTAGALGLPFAYAHHLNADGTLPALAAYRENFRPSAQLASPYVIVCAMVLAADNDERARWLGTPLALTMLRLRGGFRQDPYASPQEAADYPYTPEERELVREYLDTRIIGGPDVVRRRISDLLTQTGADELMVITIVHDHNERVHSYELVTDLVAGC
ncbi:LLM class flavin-dependent oxidoreductase [Actinocrispum wychmicini]|uniref:Luciferase family oxidoreductase group 1 n=1 Tax=Actinocrispum wychmicini TaxID=1213861 RepID=A0A4R2JC45_9PSEU|nr:LLM class flavin-dependent oxidoreductase [Actinocrispum wychmicini]TCO55987.1 luciferase family oxidoreductase group 1 [Actinocrispum wychmicini]